MQRLGIDVGIVEGMLTGRLDALHLEGQPAAIARRVGEELNVVVSVRILGHYEFGTLKNS